MHRLRQEQEIDEDSLSQLLMSLHVRSTVYCRSQLRAPWGFAVQARDASAFHLVTAGACWLEVDGLDEPMWLDSADLAVLVDGRAHRLRDTPSSRVEWLDDILGRTPVEHGRLRYGGSGPVTGLLCGGFRVEGAQAHPLLLAMPPVLRLRGREPSTSAWLDQLLAMLDVEVQRPRAGSDAVLARLADIMLTQAIRTHLLSLVDGEEPGVRALRDGRITKAIRLVHADPARPWTVDELAVEVAMSRSAFADRFRHLTGEPPMRYVTRCRLSRAASYLADEGATLLDIAIRSGYDSEASFTRAFSRHFGMAPGAYRRRIRERAPDLQLLPDSAP